MIVDVRLDELDLNQCPMDYHVANAFGNTARCQFETTYVSIYSWLNSNVDYSSHSVFLLAVYLTSC